MCAILLTLGDVFWAFAPILCFALLILFFAVVIGFAIKIIKRIIK